MVLRLDPRFPVIWRSPSALQIGTHTGVMLDPVAPPTERAVTAIAIAIEAQAMPRPISTPAPITSIQNPCAVDISASPSA